MLSPIAALSFVYDMRMSLNTYQLLRNATKIVPSKHILKIEIEKCLQKNIHNKSALLPLEPALDTTVERIFSMIEDENKQTVPKKP